MANITVNLAYVNQTKFTPGDKPRLNLKLSETLGKGDDKKYINYETTIWDDEAVYYSNLLDEKPKGVVCSFSGYITDIATNTADNGKVYTTVRLNLNKAGVASTFNLLPDFRKTASKSTSNLADDDF